MRARWWFLLSWLIVAFPATAYELAGRVVGVIDGDTLDLVSENKMQVRVRLAGIDAPEKAQPYGDVAQRKLSELVFGHIVVVEWHKKDRYGRVVGKVLRAGQDVDLALVEVGLAWHYRKYANEQSVPDRLTYRAAESSARMRRIGLWREPNPLAPWDFRPKRGVSPSWSSRYGPGSKSPACGKRRDPSDCRGR
jgi:endonuclease YncB( thermonuclease family)